MTNFWGSICARHSPFLTYSKTQGSGGSVWVLHWYEKGGVLKHGRSDLRRHMVVAAAAATMVVTPLALLGSGSGAIALASSPVHHVSEPHGVPSASALAHALQLRDIQSVDARIAVPSTTTTTTTAPHVAVAPPTTAPAPHVAVTPPTTAPVTHANSVSGQGTWYDWQVGQCASPTLPHGTRVTVTNLDTGASASCLVTDTEASGWPRVLDMDPSVFNQISPNGTSAGVLNISVSW